MSLFGGFSNLNQFDPDAGAFINATGIAGIEAQAINTLVNQLKAANLWQPMYAIYPMVGGTAFTHKFNLKNPQDTNAAYRLNFQGGWTHNSSGAKPDGVSGTYADTYAIPSTIFNAGAPSTGGSGHFSYYSFTNNAAADDVEMGVNDGASTTCETLLALRFSDNNQYVFWAQQGGGASSGSTSSGYMICNVSTTNVEGWRNGTRVINTGTYTCLPAVRSFYLGAQNNGTTSYRNSSRGCAFATIGRSMSVPGAVNLTNIVNAFNKTLNRNVF